MALSRSLEEPAGVKFVAWMIQSPPEPTDEFEDAFARCRDEPMPYLGEEISMTTRVEVFPAGHTVQVKVMDLQPDGSWALAQTHIIMPGQEAPPWLYATTTRKIEVIDLEPEGK